MVSGGLELAADVVAGGFAAGDVGRVGAFGFDAGAVFPDALAIGLLGLAQCGGFAGASVAGCFRGGGQDVAHLVDEQGDGVALEVGGQGVAAEGVVAFFEGVEDVLDAPAVFGDAQGDEGTAQGPGVAPAQVGQAGDELGGKPLCGQRWWIWGPAPWPTSFFSLTPRSGGLFRALARVW